MEGAMSERAKNTSWFWMRIAGTAIVTLSITTCGGAEQPAEDEVVESTLDQPDVSTLMPESVVI